MNERLNDLLAKYNETKEMAVEKQKDIDVLEQQVKEKQDALISRMKNDLQEFSKYIIHGYDPYVTLRINSSVLSFYDKEHPPILSIRFQKDGSNIELLSSPLRNGWQCVFYDLKSDKWPWYKESCIKAITENYEEVYAAIEEAVVNHIQKKTTSLNELTANTMDSLSSSLDKLKVTNSPSVEQQKKDQATLLFKAISLLVDETFEQYDDSHEWLKMIENELGFTVDEMKELGVVVTVDGGVYKEYEEKSVKVMKTPFNEMVESAKQRSESPKAVQTGKEEREI